MQAFCPTCRRRFEVPTTPPHAVIHSTSERVHRHAITREVLVVADAE